MDIERLRQIANLELPDEAIKHHVIAFLANQPNIIPILLDILGTERRLKNEAISDANQVIWKCKVGLNNRKMNKDNFIQKEIQKLYEKHKGIFFDLAPQTKKKRDDE